MAKAENRFTLSGLKDYKLEGLVNYQSSCDCQVNKEFDNLLTFSNSYLGESAFVKDKDSYFSILIGGNNRDQAKSPLLTNLTLHGEWAADDFEIGRAHV